MKGGAFHAIAWKAMRLAYHTPNKFSRLRIV